MSGGLDTWGGKMEEGGRSSPQAAVHSFVNIYIAFNMLSPRAFSHMYGPFPCSPEEVKLCSDLFSHWEVIGQITELQKVDWLMIKSFFIVIISVMHYSEQFKGHGN